MAILRMPLGVLPVRSTTSSNDFDVAAIS